MAVWLGQISPVTGTTVTVTGIPFEPVAVMFFGVHNALTNISQCFGAASGSSEQWAIWTGARQETSGYNERHQETRDDACIYLYSLTDHTTLQSKGVLSALTSDGFSVAFTGAGGTAQQIFYVAIGGRNIAAAKAGTFVRGSSTGTLAVTGAGFEPRALVVGHTANATINSQGGGLSWGLGFTDGTNHFANYGFGYQGTATRGSHIQRSDAVAVGYIDAISADYVLELDSLDSDGFTVDVTNSWVANIQHGYLAIDCEAAAVGVAGFPNSTGVQSYSTPGFKPGGVLFSWNGGTVPSSTGSTTMPVRLGVGAMDGVTVVPTKTPHGVINGLHRDTAPFGAYQPLQTWDNNAALQIVGAGSQVDPSATTVFHQGVVNGFDQGSFEVDWTISSTDSLEFGWLALPGDLAVSWVPHIYRRVLAT